HSRKQGAGETYPFLNVPGWGGCPVGGGAGAATPGPVVACGGSTTPAPDAAQGLRLGTATKGAPGVRCALRRTPKLGPPPSLAPRALTASRPNGQGPPAESH